MSTPTSQSSAASDELLDEYADLMVLARAGRMEAWHFQRLEEIYALAPELRSEDGR